MTDTREAPEESPVLAEWRKKYGEENVVKELSFIPMESTNLRTLFYIAQDLFYDSESCGIVVTNSTPLHDDIMAELQSLLANPDLSDRSIQAAQCLKAVIKEDGEDNFLKLTDAALKEKNGLRVRSFLESLTDIDDLYSDGSGFTSQRKNSVTVGPTKGDALSEGSDIPEDVSGCIFTRDYPIGVARDLKKRAEDIGLEPELVAEKGSKAFALMFSGANAEILRSAGAEIHTGFQERVQRTEGKRAR